MSIFRSGKSHGGLREARLAEDERAAADRRVRDAGEDARGGRRRGAVRGGGGDLWTDRQLYDRALGGAGEATPRILGPVCPVYVSRGLGIAVLPVRLGSVPEVAVIELRAASGRGANVGGKTV